MSTPALEGFTMPPEWAAQKAVWLSWPVHDYHWPDRLPIIQGVFARLAAAISKHALARVNAAPEHHEAIRKAVLAAGADPATLELFPHPTDDVWCRDHGPTFVKHRVTGEVAMTDWKFNAWGGKYEPHDSDDAVPARIASALGMRRFRSELCFEGGGLEVDGAGRVLTTESVALNTNRNPEWTRARVEQELRDFLGVDDVLWLPSGLEGDDTDGHIDTLTRFTAPNTVLTAVETDPSDVNFPVLDRNRRMLLEMGLTVIDLPQPDPIAAPDGWRVPRLPGTYANFLVVNDAVLVPTYQQPGPDARALGIIGDAFPGRRAIGFDSLEILLEGGAIHCLTQQEPE